MSNGSHTVLGANGVIGRETVKALRARSLPVRAVNRSSSGGAEMEEEAGDLADSAFARAAIAGSAVVYLVLGLPYTLRDWQALWPRVMENCIEACLATGAKLVFFDNAYAYGLVRGAMTEETPLRPCSKKGAVRAALISMVEQAHRERGLTYVIARCADFYGPQAKTSAFNVMVTGALARGKKPSWFADAKKLHSMTYTPDAGEALAMLGTDTRADGRAWHIPTAHPPRTGAEYIEIAAAASGRPLAYRVVSPLMVRVLGLFVPALRESVEMLYQNADDYVFDSSRFEQTFGMKPTRYEDGIHATIAAETPGMRSAQAA